MSEVQAFCGVSLNTPVQQDVHGALVILRFQHAVGAGVQFGDFAHHAGLMNAHLWTLIAHVLQDNGNGFGLILLRPPPTLHGGAHKAHHGIGALGVLQPCLQHIQTVLQRSPAEIVKCEHDQFIGAKTGRWHRIGFVAGHGCDAIHLSTLQSEHDIGVFDQASIRQGGVGYIGFRRNVDFEFN